MGHAATPLGDEALAVLAERTEGWAAGLRLAALTLHYGGAIDPQTVALHAENRYVMDYLVDEVLSHVAPEMEDFLVETSILDTLCGPLCDALVDPDGLVQRGQAYLQMLEATSMFTVALDEQGNWYRYHHLFQGLLQSRLAQKLDAHAIATLHSRASAWYAGHDFPEAALEHALAGHDMPTAAQLVAQHRHHLLDTEQRPRLKRWLRLFPAATLAQHPDLLLARVWVAEIGQANSQTIAETLDLAQLLVSQMAERPEHARQLRGEIDALRCGAISFRSQ